MFTTTYRVEQIRRQAGVVRFDVCLVPDDKGFQHYKLCAEQRRHYSVKFVKGKGHPIPSTYTVCDHSCDSGKLVENAPPELLLAVGIYKRVPKDQVLVVQEERYHIESHKEYAAGSIVGPEMVSSGKFLKNGESMLAIRTLNHTERIDLTPRTVNGGNWRRVREQERVITQIVDKITNIDGKAVVTNNEAELRAQRDRLDQEFQAGIKMAEGERENRRRDYAREVGKFLRVECGFTFEQVGRLFEVAGPGQCLDAVERARQEMADLEKPRVLENEFDFDDYDVRMDLGIMAYAYRSLLEHKDWRRIQAGADYIVSIGGVPADKKKK